MKLNNNTKNIKIVFFILIIIGLFLLGLYQTYVSSYNNKKDTIVIEIPKTIYDTIDILEIELTQENVLYMINYYDLKHADIVLAQSILETGYYTSTVCRNYNNIFGLYDSINNDYYKFNHWSESVLAYKKYVQRKYNTDSCYYTFLKELPYAEDPMYINKIKKIVKRNENIDIR